MKKINIKKIPSRNKLTSEPITEIVNVKYKQSWLKPSGFWYGLKHYWMDFYTNDWKRKKATKFKYDGFIYKISINKNIFTSIDSPDKNKILQIKNKKDLKKMEQIYNISNKETKNLDKKIGSTNIYVNWKKVAKDFGGIEIKYNPWDSLDYYGPNNSNKNYLPFWYTTWDVPSGCIWSWFILKNLSLALI